MAQQIKLLMLEVTVVGRNTPWSLWQNTVGESHPRLSEFWIKAMPPFADKYSSFKKQLLACYQALHLTMDQEDNYYTLHIVWFNKI